MQEASWILDYILKEELSEEKKDRVINDSKVNGFHGKSLGAVSVTGKGGYRKPYLPMIQGVQHNARVNRIESPGIIS